jgi:ABC-type transporter Mla MlaB component
MLRILSTPSEPVATIRLEGKLRRAWVPEVRAAVAAARAVSKASDATRVDLEGLTFVDQEGLELLSELAAGGVNLVGASPFVSELLANFARHGR